MSQDLIDMVLVSVVLTLSLTISQIMLTVAAMKARGWMVQQREEMEQVRQLITRDWE